MVYAPVEPAIGTAGAVIEIQLSAWLTWRIGGLGGKGREFRELFRSVEVQVSVNRRAH